MSPKNEWKNLLSSTITALLALTRVAGPLQHSRVASVSQKLDQPQLYRELSHLLAIPKAAE